ncbi:hypothetical protein Aazo_4497 ['Nostoc azollae' 0708]|uniref:Uncharacterized protein n=1 Tax=Nostoc azollae (strain 0708) TaxID=551115 RepID=D7DX58_NOSA0|nr:hypothetical protein Aazo_4497 ['Nostoc azollae' 0708]
MCKIDTHLNNSEQINLIMILRCSIPLEYQMQSRSSSTKQLFLNQGYETY